MKAVENPMISHGFELPRALWSLNLGRHWMLIELGRSDMISAEQAVFVAGCARSWYILIRRSSFFSQVGVQARQAGSSGQII